MAMLPMSFPREWAVVYYLAAAVTSLLHAGAALAQARVPSAPGARTGLLVAARKTLYVAVPARGTSPAEIRVYTVR